MTERSIKIIEIVKEKKSARIKELASLLNVTEITIRRDLEDLIKHEFVTMSKGVIELTSGKNRTMPLDFRLVLNMKSKIEIAKCAASLIKDNYVVFIDSGSTTVQMLDYINTHNNVFVTSGINIAQEATKRGLRAFLLPGFLNTISDSVYGEDSIKILSNMNFDLAFVGVAGISNFYRFATNSSYSAAIKRVAIANSAHSYVLADSTKFNTLGFSTFADFDQATLITNEAPESELRNLKYIVADSLK